MSYKSYPEIKLAVRLISRKKLAPPIDIFHLAGQYAKVDSLFIPFDVDGISLHLKVPGRKPHIIINQGNPERRIRFTLAHELGHILIPWHIGSIIDNTLMSEEDKYDEYWHLEAEANRFASELLMPSIWVKDVIEEQKHDLFKITKNIVKNANVSSHAATLKIKDNIGPGHVFVALTGNNEVLFSGKSDGTLAVPPSWGDEISPDELFPFCGKRFDFEINGFYYYWWHFDDTLSIPKTDSIGDWRELLNGIVSEIGIPSSKQTKFKQSLNGVISYANSQVRGSDRTQNSLYSAALQRLHGKSEYKNLINHKDFNAFILSKVDSLLNR